MTQEENNLHKNFMEQFEWRLRESSTRYDSEKMKLKMNYSNEHYVGILR